MRLWSRYVFTSSDFSQSFVVNPPSGHSTRWLCRSNMNHYTLDEYAYVHELTVLQKICRRYTQTYADRYTNQYKPQHQKFAHFHQQLYDTGSVNSNCHGKKGNRSSRQFHLRKLSYCLSKNNHATAHDILLADLLFRILQCVGYWTRDVFFLSLANKYVKTFYFEVFASWDSVLHTFLIMFERIPLQHLMLDSYLHIHRMVNDSFYFCKVSF